MTGHAAGAGAELPPAGSALFETIARQLEDQGYAVMEDALPRALGAGLLEYLGTVSHDEFREARIGRGTGRWQDRSVRRDRIHWIQADHPQGTAWLGWLDDLRRFLNRRLYLGLRSMESHFSLYHPGDYYRRHRDAFRGQANRILSLVTYLNPDWEQDLGGELVLYSPEPESNDTTELVRVLPNMGTLVLFLSEEYPHEVLPAAQDRISVAAWFRRSDSPTDTP